MDMKNSDAGANIPVGLVKSVSVIGLGKLGSPMAAVFAKKGLKVVGVDLNKQFVEYLNAGKAPVQEPQLQEFISEYRDNISATTSFCDAVLASEVTFIIVPTPSGSDDFFINDNVISAMKEIGSALRDKDDYHMVVVTSTVMPGSTGGPIRKALEEASGRKVGENLGLCYNPEFIALGSVVHDMLFPDMILIGESDDKAGSLLESIYRQSIESDAEFQRMNWVNAELCKIAVNTYVTTKISYANMIADMCDRLPTADSDVVTRALGADSRIGKKYIKGATGYGGPCFPRDNKAFAALGRSIGARTDLAEATDKINNYQVERLLELISAAADDNVPVAVLGLSYKPDTAVVEESHGVFLANALAQQGRTVHTFDPRAWPNTLGENIKVFDNAADAISGAEVVVFMTAWPDFKQIDFTTLPNAGDLKVIDPWHLFDSAETIGVKRHIRPGAITVG
ncbi:MAG: UDP-glucose 6-dehydrogenase AglM [Rhizobiaceae bacterium]